MNGCKEFHAAFQISRTVIFQVAYYTLGSNSSPHFSTSANEFCKNKRDWKRGGQAQDALLPKGKAREFWEKWDKKHLHHLSVDEYEELQRDLEALKQHCNYIYQEKDSYANRMNAGWSFSDLKELSMLPVMKEVA